MAALPVAGSFRCLHHEFTVSAAREEHRAAVHAALAPFAVTSVSGPRVTAYALDTRDGRHRLVVDGQEARVSTDPIETLDLLLWYVGEHVVASAEPYVLVHSGAVTAPDGRVLLLPGTSGSGKSTTTLGLVQRGFRYLSDELAVLDPTCGHVLPFPRPIALKAGTRAAMPEVDRMAVFAPADPSHTVHVAPDPLHGSGATASAPVAWVAFPTYQPELPTSLEPLAPAAVCQELLLNTFRLAERPRECLDVAAAISRGATGFRLTVGDLATAVEQLVQLTGSESLDPAR